MNDVTTIKRWHCNWNWCPKVFEHGRDLLDHLKQEHFTNILRVEKDHWSEHLRAYEGSGVTDSLLKAIPTQSSQLPSSSSSDGVSESSQVRSTGPTHSSPPPALANSSLCSAGPSPPPPPPPPVARDAEPALVASHPVSPPPELSPAPPFNARTTFTGFGALLGPHTTREFSNPPIPELDSLVKDAIRRDAPTVTKSITQHKPTLPLPRASSSKTGAVSQTRTSARTTSLPLPRKLTKSTQKSSSSPLLPRKHRCSASSESSSSSSRDVETQLTENVDLSASLSQSQSQPQSQPDSQPSAYSSDQQPSLLTQTHDDSPSLSGVDASSTSSEKKARAPRSFESGRIHIDASDPTYLGLLNSPTFPSMKLPPARSSAECSPSMSQEGSLRPPISQS